MREISTVQSQSVRGETHRKCRSVYMDHYTAGNYEFLLHGGKRCKLASTGHFWVRKEKQSAVVYRMPCKECAASFSVTYQIICNSWPTVSLISRSINSGQLK